MNYSKEQFWRRIIQTIFGSKWFSLPWTFKLRLWAYRKVFKIGNNVVIENDVWLARTHGLPGTIQVGNRVLLARHAEIDYTGGVVLDDDVAISERAILVSHGHDSLNLKSKKINLTPLHVAEGAWICTNAMIMPGVNYIGKHSIVSPGSMVYKKVPDYAIVRGNPAEIVAVVPPKARGWKQDGEAAN